MEEINLSSFNLEYCKLFSADQLRKMYNGEPKEVLDTLIEKLGLSVEPEPKQEPKPEPIPRPEVPAKDESPEAAKEADPEAEVLPEKEPDVKNSSKK